MYIYMCIYGSFGLEVINGFLLVAHNCLKQRGLSNSL